MNTKWGSILRPISLLDPAAPSPQIPRTFRLDADQESVRMSLETTLYPYGLSTFRSIRPHKWAVHEIAVKSAVWTVLDCRSRKVKRSQTASVAACTSQRQNHGGSWDGTAAGHPGVNFWTTMSPCLAPSETPTPPIAAASCTSPSLSCSSPPRILSTRASPSKRASPRPNRLQTEGRISEIRSHEQRPAAPSPTRGPPLPSA